MKPVWIPTLVWIASVIAAVLLAWANPDHMGVFKGGEVYRPVGASVPR
jgi:hypothetical protein